MRTKRLARSFAALYRHRLIVKIVDLYLDRLPTTVVVIDDADAMWRQ